MDENQFRTLSNQIHSVDKRLAVIEERTQGLPKLKERVAVASAVVALLVSLVTAFLIKSNDAKLTLPTVPSISISARK